MGNACCDQEKHEYDVEFNQSAREAKGFNNNARNDRKLQANPYAGGANLGRSSILQTNAPRQNNQTQGNTPEDHKPTTVVAAEVLHMNPASDNVTLKKLSLAPFAHKESVTHASNPKLGPFRYKSSGDTYKGQYFKGQRQGYGELVTKSGETYVGEWDYDQCNGIGRLILPNGDYYEGEFLGNRANGKGIFTSQETGITYEGEFKDDMQEGKGKETYPDGSFYYGQFVGKSNNITTSLKYLLFLGDKKHGIGSFTFADGGKYTGRFVQDNISGQGKYIYPDGRVYEGEWKNNKKHGVGIYQLDGGITYKGGFMNGKRNGKGTLKW